MKVFIFITLLIFSSITMASACGEYYRLQYRSAVEQYKQNTEQCYPDGSCVYVKSTGRIVQQGTPGFFYEIWESHITPGGYQIGSQQILNCIPLPIIQPPPDPPNECVQSGSVIHPHTQVLGEEIPLVGSAFKLNYFTSRVRGRTANYKLNLQLSDSYIYTDLVDLDS